MRIASLNIDNFRGIQRVESGELGDTIIVAGQNGSGKSCIFDAIRLLKSTYGGYQQNEWQQFFGEFQIQLHGGSKNLRGLFNDPSRDITIEADFRLRDREKAYITANAKSLMEETLWQQLLPEAFQYGGYQKALFAAQFRERQPEVDKRVTEVLPSVMHELAQKSALGKVVVRTDGNIIIQASNLLTVAFTNYRPREIGVIDFHGAQRHYGRENVQGINLSLDQARQSHSQHTLYNYNNKYNNVKSEMAGNYIKEILAEKAGSATESGPSLLDTMKELFESFFPDKKFLGPKPTIDGSLTFPVKTAFGNEHDLDELSSGEKEILYGYLRIRSSAPRDSIILLDEPELHLNPRLIRGLPEFYRKHLGEILQNQLWLVTHSDALIREAVGKPGFNVFHMLPCGSDNSNTSQLRPLTVTADLDLVMADLVGDLAAYRPGGKGLIFEGGGDTDFDKTFVGALFAEELRGINLISGTNKSKVKALHEILARAHHKGDLPTKFYAITDKDTGGDEERNPAVDQYTWDVYHIENYLLEAELISDALNSFGLTKRYDRDMVSTILNDAARNVLPGMLITRMRTYANSKIVRCVDLGFAPNTLTIGKELSAAAKRSVDRMTATVSEDLSEEKLVQEETRIRNDIEKDFSTGEWIKNLPGRDILKQLVDLESVPVNYEVFRNMLVSRMVERGQKPESMENIIDQICAD